MAKSFTTPQQTALAASHHVEAILVEIDFASGVQRYTTAAASLPASLFDPGSRSLAWAGGANPTAIDLIRETEGSEAVGLKITLDGISSSQISLALSQHIQGRRFSMWLAPMSATSYTLIDTPALIFEGMLDVMYPELRDNGESALVVEVESDMARLLRPAIRRYTDRDHQQRFPGDGIFRFAGQVDKVIVWPAASYFRQ